MNAIDIVNKKIFSPICKLIIMKLLSRIRSFKIKQIFFLYVPDGGRAFLTDGMERRAKQK